jgi:hypothetical protein
MLPFLVEQSLQIDPSLIDRRTRGIEYEAVPDHEFEVFKELGGVRVLSSVKLEVRIVDMSILITL